MNICRNTGDRILTKYTTMDYNVWRVAIGTADLPNLSSYHNENVDSKSLNLLKLFHITFAILFSIADIIFINHVNMYLSRLHSFEEFSKKCVQEIKESKYSLHTGY